MRIFLTTLLVLHALIHGLGFVKAFGLATVKELTLPIPKVYGLLWLLAGLCLLLAALLWTRLNSLWWLPGLVGVGLSQALILVYWPDARFGTLPNLLLLFVFVVGYGTWNFYRSYQNDVQLTTQQPLHFGHNLLTEADLLPLPRPVQKYLHYAGCVGKPKVNNFRIELTGRIRKNAQSDWMPFTTEQYNFMHTPTRLFYMKAAMKGLPVGGYHHYKNGKAVMDIRLFSLFRVQYQEGQEMDVAETVTFFNDMCCMAPATLIDPRIEWLEVRGNAVKAAFTHNQVTITAWLYFNDEGTLINFVSNDRYAADAGKKLPWSTPLSEPAEINGRRLATFAEAVYEYPEGPLTYGTFRITDVEYNCEEITKEE
jgi:hypothetical protein